MERKTAITQVGGGLLRRAWSRLCDPGVGRYAPFVELRTFGRATAIRAARGGQEEESDDRPRMPLSWRGPLPGAFLHH